MVKFAIQAINLSNEVATAGLSVFLAFMIPCVLNVYLGSFLETSTHRLKQAIAWAIFFIWQFFINQDATALPSWVNLLLTFVSVELVVVGSYKRVTKKHLAFDLFIGLMFVVHWMFLESIAYTGLWLVMGHTPSPLPVSISSKVLLLVVVQGIREFATRKKLDQKLENMGMVLAIPIFSVMFHYSVYMFGQVAGMAGAEILLWMALLAILLLVLNLFIYPLYAKMLGEIQRKKNTNEYIKQLENYRQRDQDREEVLEEVHYKLHNIKQELLCLHGLAAQQKNKCFEKKVAAMLNQIIEYGKAIAETGNIAIDSIINNKWNEAKKQGIYLNTDIRVLCGIQMEDMDLAVVLGNALDNACEAAACLPSNKEVSLALEVRKGMFKLVVANRYVGEIKRAGSQRRIQSSKKVGRHGMGLPSIGRIVDKYHGTMEIKTEGGRFVLEITMYEN